MLRNRSLSPAQLLSRCGGSIQSKWDMGGVEFVGTCRVDEGVGRQVSGDASSNVKEPCYRRNYLLGRIHD